MSVLQPTRLAVALILSQFLLNEGLNSIEIGCTVFVMVVITLYLWKQHQLRVQNPHEAVTTAAVSTRFSDIAPQSPHSTDTHARTGTPSQLPGLAQSDDERAIALDVLSSSPPPPPPPAVSAEKDTHTEKPSPLVVPVLQELRMRVSGHCVDLESTVAQKD